MKKLDLGNGHTLVIETANRGLQDDYKITFLEDNKKLFEEYGTQEYIEYEYEVKFQRGLKHERDIKQT